MSASFRLRLCPSGQTTTDVDREFGQPPPPIPGVEHIGRPIPAPETDSARYWRERTGVWIHRASDREEERDRLAESLRGAVGRERELREALETIAADADGIWRARFAREELRRIYRRGEQS